jgi:hypothetical protein
MRKVVDALTLIFGALSLALLAKRGFNLGFAAPFEQALKFYEKGLHQLLGWIEPYWDALLARMGWQLHVHPHWKNILVLMLLYFGVVTKVIWPKFRSAKERVLLFGLTAWGIVLAIIASVAAGTVDLNDSTTNAIMAAFPLSAFALYQFAWCGYLATLGRQETWWIRYRAATRLYIGPRVVAAIVAALALILLSGRIPILTGLRNPGLALLIGLSVLLAVYWLWTGVEGAVYFHKPPEKTWWQTFRDMKWRQSWAVTSNARIGLGMLKCIGGAIVFVLLGAGLE